MSDAWKTLCALLKESGAVVTFSANCCSGIVGVLGKHRRCQCWRCRKERGQTVTEKSEIRAAALSKKAQKAFSKRTCRIMRQATWPTSGKQEL